MKSSAKFKFCLTRLVMLLLCLWTLAPQAKAAWYIMGDSPFTWTAGSQEQLTDIGSNKYRIIKSTTYTSSTWINFILTSSNSSSWDDINDDRYGSSNGDGINVYDGQWTQTYQGNNGGNIWTELNSGSFIWTWDATSKKIRIDKNTNKLYVFGKVSSLGIDWNPTQGCLMSSNDGITYTINNVVLAAGDEFGFTMKLSSSADDWTTANSVRFGPTSTKEIEEGASLQMTDFGGQNKYTVSSTSAGTYDISVNILTCKATITKHTVPTYTATVYVYDTTAPTLNGEAMTTEDGRYCVWYKGTVTNTSTLTANIAGSGTLSATLQDGETYYYYWNGTSYVATDIDYNPWANNSITIYVGTKNADESFVPYLYLWYYIGNSKKEPKGSFVTGSNVNNNLMILNQTTEINGQKYWYETFTGIEKLNAIVHNNAGVQTADINNITADRYIIFNPTKSTGSQPYYNESVPKPAKKTFTVHVIDKNGKTPNLYVWDKDGEMLNGGFPGSIPSETETINDETWYKQTFQADDYINVIVSNNSQNQTADITEWTDADLYITYDGNATEQADRVVYKAATAPAEQQQTHYSYVIYVNNVREPQTSPNVYVYVNTGYQNAPLNGEWNQDPVFGGNASTVSETLADGNLYWKTTINTIYSPINIQFSINSENQSGLVNGNIQQTDEVGYYKYYSGDDDSGDRYEVVNDLYLYTGEMYVIGKVAGNPWAANAGLKMTAEDGGIFTLNNVQIIADAQFAFASKLGSDENDWAGLNRYRLTSAATGDWWGVTNAMTDKTNPQALPLVLYVDADKNFKMDETAYYNISLNLPARTVTITRAQDALYMFYGNSESPYWKPNAGVPMISTDGITYTLTGVELNEGDTFQFTKQLSNSATDWNSIAAYRLGADAQGDYWEVTSGEIGIVLENALLLGSTKNFQMDPGTDGNYRVVVNPTAKTVVLYPMAQVLGSKVILHLEQTSNVATPKLWAYDKERNLANTAYIHVDRPSRHEIATNRHKFYENKTANEDSVITTADGRKWWTWEVPNAIVDFWFTRGDYTYDEVDESNPDMTDIQWRHSGEIFLTWPSTGTALDEFTRDYYAAAAQEAAECAVMIEGHMYAYFTNTPGWDHVFCHAWYTDSQGDNHDLLTPPAPYTGNPTYPGALCELVGYDKDGYEVWRIDLTEHGVTTYPNGGILFNNGIDNNHNYEHDLNHDYYTGTGTTAAKEQTGDFAYSTGACYDYCGVIVLGRSLSNIITKGVVDGPVYTIEEDLVGVWFDENAETVIEVDGATHTMYGALYCKDMNNFVSTPYVEKSLAKEGEIDYMLTRTNLMSGKGRYDQSNWVKLTLSTQYPGIESMDADAQKRELHKLEGMVLPAESVRGQLVNNVNPEMRLALQALPESNQANNYNQDPNVFVTSSFIGTQECEEPADEFGHVHRNTYFFVTPKPQEFAKITWAVYGGDNAFYVPKHGSYAYVDGHYEFMNEGDLDGYFPVQWNLQPKPNDITVNQAYSFHAIIRLADESQTTTTGGGSTLRAGQPTVDYKPYSGTVKYVVSPIDISSANIITAVSDVTKTKTVKQVRYYNLTGIESCEPFDGVNVVVTTYTDGTKSTAKVLK